jgi:hypothetical protein
LLSKHQPGLQLKVGRLARPETRMSHLDAVWTTRIHAPGPQHAWAAKGSGPWPEHGRKLERTRRSRPLAQATRRPCLSCYICFSCEGPVFSSASSVCCRAALVRRSRVVNDASCGAEVQRTEPAAGLEGMKRRRSHRSDADGRSLHIAGPGGSGPQLSAESPAGARVVPG